MVASYQKQSKIKNGIMEDKQLADEKWYGWPTRIFGWYLLHFSFFTLHLVPTKYSPLHLSKHNNNIKAPGELRKSWPSNQGFRRRSRSHHGGVSRSGDQSIPKRRESCLLFLINLICQPYLLSISAVTCLPSQF